MGSWWPLILAFASCVMCTRLLSSWIPGDASTHLPVLWSLRKQDAARSTCWLELMGVLMMSCCQHSYLWGFLRDLPIGCSALCDWPRLSLRSPSPPVAPSPTAPAHQPPSLSCPWILQLTLPLTSTFSLQICAWITPSLCAPMLSPQRSFLWVH